MARNKNDMPTEKELDASAAAKKHFNSYLSQDPDDPFSPVNMYDKYRVGLQITNRITSGIPLNPNLIATWVRASLGFKPTDTLDAKALQMIEDMKKKLEDTKRLRQLAIVRPEEKEELDDVLNTLSDETASEASGTVFLSDQKGLYYETRCLKASFKECFSLLHIFPKRKGMKDQVQHGTFRIFGGDPDHTDRIYLGRTEPDGVEERPIQIKGKSGTISALKRSEYVVKPYFEFDVWILRNPPKETYHVGENDLRLALTLMQLNGVGSQRSQGDGENEIVYFERLDVVGQPPYKWRKKEAA